jgi:hypothetical protein
MAGEKSLHMTQEMPPSALPTSSEFAVGNPMPKRKKLLPLLPLIRRLRGEGVSDAEIARKLGCVQSSVLRIAGKLGRYGCNSRGKPSRPYAHPAAFIAEARRLWDLGYKMDEIARSMGVTKGVIAGVAHRNEFPARRPGYQFIAAARANGKR